jgi:predicted lipid-binding transport protein (Tim44 family)
MQRLFTTLFTLAVALGLMINSAEAARVGGGRSMGIQRSAPIQKQATPPAAAPQQAKPAAPATQPQPAGNRWFGPLAGLAAGLGLGWLLGNGGFGGLGGMFGGLLMILLLVAVGMLLFRMFARRGESPRPMQFANLGGNETASPPRQHLAASEPVSGGSSPGNASFSQPQIPAGFDVESFVKQAKRNFLQLQEANDRADLNELREVSTDEMFEALKGDMAARGSRQQQTEVVNLDAALLEVVTEGKMHWASVRFTGSVRESPHSAPETFDEVWHLQKPVSGETGWLLAGIQQPA